MTPRLEALVAALQAALGDKLVGVDTDAGEATIAVRPAQLLAASTLLRDAPALKFEQLIDLCGVDYSDYGEGAWDGSRFAVVYHLLSVTHNHRVRVRLFADDDDFPVVDSVTGIWPGANWFEREAFDLYGIMFTGHPDLRRLLTDYGFIGHPFRKDFPLSGTVEMRYDPDQKRVIYQPVTIEPRVITPRTVREDKYGDTEGFRRSVVEHVPIAPAERNG